MSFILLSSITIGLFAFGGTLYLMWRQRDRRIVFLAAMAAVVVFREAAVLLGTPLTWTISFPGPNQDLPGLMVSIIVWVAVFFLERMIRERREAEEGLNSAQARLSDAYGLIKNQYGLIKDQKDRMERELNVGRDIQMSMVPLTFPPFPNRKEISIYGSLEPAREIGGDFFDFFFIDDDRLCFCIGDVSGKGVPAALFMAVTKTLIKSRATDDPSTASVLTHANDELSRDNPNGMFVTLFIGVLDIRSGEFDYTNAGHNPPYLIRTDGPPEAMSDRHGPIVGAMKGMVYRKGTDVMLPGDILYMYTDGVTEEMDTDENGRAIIPH